MVIYLNRGFVMEEYMIVFEDNFLQFSIKNTYCGYSLEVPQRGEIRKIIAELSSNTPP